MTIDADKLRALHEAANSKTMHPEDVAAARFQLGNFAKGLEFLTLLAMAEDNRRLREALEEAAQTFKLVNDRLGQCEHDRASHAAEMGEEDARQALAAPGEKS